MKYKIFCGLLAICLAAANETWDSDFEAGQQSYQQGHIVDAENSYRSALNTADAFSSGDIRRLRSLLGLARVLREETKFSESEKLYQRALTECEPVWGANHPNTAAALNGLAMLYQRSGRYSQAEALFRRILLIEQTTGGPQSPQFATALNNLGSLYVTEGRYTSAEPILQQALEIFQRQGTTGIELADALYNLALVKQVADKKPEADSLYRAAIDVYEKHVGSDHPKFATVVYNRATLLSEMGRHVEAEELFRRSIKSYERSFGPDSPRLIYLLNEYATLLRNMHRKSEARQINNRVARICSRHPEIKMSSMKIDVNALGVR